MTSLNLIPATYQQHIKMHTFLHAGKLLFLWIFFEILLITIALLISQVVLQNTFISTVHNTTLVTKNPVNFRAEVNKVNTSLTFIQSLQKEFFFMTPVAVQLFAMTHPEITLHTLALNFEKEAVTISGNAKNRDALLRYKENLEQLAFIAPFDISIQTLLKKNDISFSFTIPLITQQLP